MIQLKTQMRLKQKQLQILMSPKLMRHKLLQKRKRRKKRRKKKKKKRKKRNNQLKLKWKHKLQKKQN
jgi:hypothetical protein